MLWEVSLLHKEDDIQKGIDYYKTKYNLPVTHVFVHPSWEDVVVDGLEIVRRATGSPITVVIGDA